MYIYIYVHNIQGLNMVDIYIHCVYIYVYVHHNPGLNAMVHRNGMFFQESSFSIGAMDPRSHPC